MTVNDVGYELPRTVRNISHDFRIAVFSFTQSFAQIARFNYSARSIGINPAGVTNVTFSCSTASSPGSGQFTLVGGLVGDINTSPDRKLNTNAQILSTNGTTATIPSKVATPNLEDSPVEVRGMDIGSMYSNLNQIIKPMDYVAIFTKDVRTNLWYGADNTSVTDDNIDNMRPKFIGIISDISIDYNAASNEMFFTVRFKTMLRLLELARYSNTLAMYDTMACLSGKDLGTTGRNVTLEMAGLGSDLRPHDAIFQLTKDDYPSELVGSRIELDQSRAEAQAAASGEQYTPGTFQGAGNYETKLQKMSQYALNKDFELFAAEDGQLVWKLPSYARGVNKCASNKITTRNFNPDNYTLDSPDTIYHLHDFISCSIQQSEAEMVNVVNGSQDFGINGMGNQFAQTLEPLRYVYFIKGGDGTDHQSDRRYGFDDIGIRPIMLRNPAYYEGFSLSKTVTINGVTRNTSTDLFHAQMYYYDFKVYKNNTSRYWTANLTMIDDPRIQCGMPCIIPKFADAGTGTRKGQLIPSIFYISATSRKYEYGKFPLLTLTLTHGRLASEEFHNGIHTFGSLSSWWARQEPGMLWELGSSDDNFLQGSPPTKRVTDFSQSDVRLSAIFKQNNDCKGGGALFGNQYGLFQNQLKQQQGG